MCPFNQLSSTLFRFFLTYFAFIKFSFLSQFINSILLFHYLKQNSALSVKINSSISNGKDYWGENRKATKWKPVKQRVILVNANTLFNWALPKRRTGLWFSKVRHTQADTEVVLVHSCGEASLGHRGTEGQGGIRLQCAGPGQPGYRSAGTGGPLHT